MTTQKINMHGKEYTLFDEVIRTKDQAKQKASEIREAGQVAFLNPRKRKDLETTYYIYVAEKAVRKKKESKPITPKKLTQKIDNQVNISPEEIDEFISGGIESDEVEALEAIDEVENGFKLCPICQTSFKPKNSRQIYDKKECSNQAKALKRAENKANKTKKANKK